jgi:predicted RNA binding protein with dsRBD fold (UPF0201 family)
MGEVEVEVKASVNPTEDPLKVKRAVENVLGNIESEVKTLGRESLLVGRATGRESLSKLYNLLRRERIRDAARGALFGGLDDKSIIFYLNKQVAYAGHVSFSEPAAESPLGSIEVQIQCDKPRELIEWLAPKTT